MSETRPFNSTVIKARALFCAVQLKAIMKQKHWDHLTESQVESLCRREFGWLDDEPQLHSITEWTKKILVQEDKVAVWEDE